MSEREEESKDASSPNLVTSSTEVSNPPMICPSGVCPIPIVAYPQTYILTKKEITKFELKIETMLRCFIGESSRHIPKHHLMGTRVADNCTRGMKKRRYLLAKVVRAYNQENWLEL
jgi:hypothetical protein